MNLAENDGHKSNESLRLSRELQSRLDLLLSKNRDGLLTEDESCELDTFEQHEHAARLLMARVRSTKNL